MYEKNKNYAIPLLKIVLMMIVTFIIILTRANVTEVKAETGEDFDANRPTYSAMAYPFFTSGPVYRADGKDVYAEIATAITEGSTDYGCGMGHGNNGPHSHSFSGYVGLIVNGRNTGRKSSYNVSASGTAYSEGASDWVACALDPDDYITYGRPEAYGDFETTSATSGYVSASGFGTSGSCSWEMYIYVDDWWGPGDNTVTEGVHGSASGTITKADNVVSYEYRFTDGTSGYGRGSYFSERVGTDKAGQRCYVTFYTESGKSCTTTINIPNAYRINYDLNGGKGNIYSSERVWSGYSVAVTSQKPEAPYSTEFLGWSTSKMPVLEYGKSLPSGSYTAGNNITLYNDVTLYAVYRTIKVPYNIT